MNPLSDGREDMVRAPSTTLPDGLSLSDALVGQALNSVWRQAILNHRNHSANDDDERDLQFLTLGLCGEAGELANFVKKRWRDGIGHDNEICKEVADVCAYAFMLCHVMGLTPLALLRTIEEKQQVFLAKMARLQAERAAGQDLNGSARDGSTPIPDHPATEST